MKDNYTKDLLHKDSPLIRQKTQDSLTFDGNLVDTGLSSANIQNNSVTNPKIADNAVTQNKIVNGTRMNLGSMIDFDEFGLISIQWGLGLRRLHGTSGSVSVDWDARLTSDSFGGPSVDWENKRLFDTTDGTSLDWAARLLLDSGHSIQIDYENHSLLSNGGTVLDWSAGTINSVAPLSANGTAGISTTVTILDRDAGIGTTTHTLTFTYGLLTSYGTS